MTLVEIMIALAIASLMTLTGWRAVVALQDSRDLIVSEGSFVLKSEFAKASLVEEE